MKSKLSFALIFINAFVITMSLSIPLVAAQARGQNHISADAEVTIKVKGMSCSTCEKALEKELRNLDGVIFVKANHKTEKVVIKYDARKQTPENFVKIINDMKYTASL